MPFQTPVVMAPIDTKLLSVVTAFVMSVPDVGTVTLVVPVVVRVREKLPLVMRLLASVSVCPCHVPPRKSVALTHRVNVAD